MNFIKHLVFMLLCTMLVSANIQAAPDVQPTNNNEYGEISMEDGNSQFLLSGIKDLLKKAKDKIKGWFGRGTDSPEVAAPKDPAQFCKDIKSAYPTRKDMWRDLHPDKNCPSENPDFNECVTKQGHIFDRANGCY